MVSSYVSKGSSVMSLLTSLGFNSEWLLATIARYCQPWI